MTDDPRSFNTPELHSLTIDDLDNLGRALIAVTQELSIVSDRLRILEDVLDSKGIAAAGLVDTHQPSEAAQTRIDESNRRIIAAVVTALSGR